MKIVGLQKLLKSRGKVITRDEDGMTFPLGETLYGAAYGEPRTGMPHDQRSAANALGVKIAVCLELNKQSDNSEIPLDLKPKEAALLLELGTWTYATLLFGAMEKALEDGGLTEEDDETSDEENVEDP